MELAGRYFGTGFGSAPISIILPSEPSEEQSLAPYQSLGDIRSERVPELLKPADYLGSKKPPGKFSTLPSYEIKSSK